MLEWIWGCMVLSLKVAIGTWGWAIGFFLIGLIIAGIVAIIGAVLK
jgi:hypothetical protein